MKPIKLKDLLFEQIGKPLFSDNRITVLAFDSKTKIAKMQLTNDPAVKFDVEFELDQNDSSPNDNAGEAIFYGEWQGAYSPKTGLDFPGLVFNLPASVDPYGDIQETFWDDFNYDGYSRDDIERLRNKIK